ncbi:Mobile element protein [Clostridiaceae bacterium JG1575]|nr:Mobile element protein [Clostridiaceae bacterium JG1575]
MSNDHGYKMEKKIYLISKPVDFRLSINGLTAYVQEVLRVSPSCGSCFLFCNKAKDKIKIVHWDFNGFWLHYKRLETGRFVWPDQRVEPYE